MYAAGNSNFASWKSPSDDGDLAREIHAAAACEVDEIGLREAQRVDREQHRLSALPRISSASGFLPKSSSTGFTSTWPCLPAISICSAVSASVESRAQSRRRGELVGDDGAGLVGEVDAIEFQRGVQHRCLRRYRSRRLRPRPCRRR